jgi:hypothetical protein
VCNSSINKCLDLLYIPQVLLSFFLQIAHGILYQQQSMPSQGKILLPVSVGDASPSSNCAKPSTIADLPTPGSDDNYFLST